MLTVDSANWVRAQSALRHEVERVVALLRDARNPSAPAVGRWSLAEVAMHLSQAWIVVPGMARSDLSEVDEVVSGATGPNGDSLLSDVWELGSFTMAGVEADPERDPTAIAERIEQRAGAYLASLGDAGPTDETPWLVNGVRVTQATLTCHLLHETVAHGYDIARADGRRWPLDRSAAAMIFEGFYIPVLSALDPRAMVDQDAARGVRAVYEIHLRGAGRATFAFDDGALSIDYPPSGARRPDCHISADPAAFLLVALARKSQWAAIARGQITAWGRKPWLGPRFRAFMRNP